MNRSKLEVITCSWRKARENACDSVTIDQFRIVQQQKNRVEVQGNNLHFPLFWTMQNANYSPEPRLCSFVCAQFETSLLVLVLPLIGWKSGANLLSQSRSVVNAKPITFRHSNENRSITWMYLSATCWTMLFANLFISSFKPWEERRSWKKTARGRVNTTCWEQIPSIREWTESYV